MTVELNIGKSCYKINCAESEKEKLLHLANKLNERVNTLSINFRGVDEKTLLVITALMLEAELSEKTDTKTTKEESNLNDEDLYNAVSDSMENVADYIEKLGKKIQNY
jgi:cell division protein ZapA (FtsZ GTPase activity inhibitor)